MAQLSIHFTSDDLSIIGLCQDYWALSDTGKWQYTVAEIARLHGMRAHIVSQVVKTSAYVLVPSQRCRECDAPYQAYVRTDLPQGNPGSGATKPFVCAQCRQEAKDQAAAQRRAAQEEATKQVELFRSRLRASYEDELSNAIPVNALTAEQRIILLALFKHSGSESLDGIEPLGSNKVDVFSPSNDMSWEMLNQLRNAALLRVSHRSPEGTLVVDEDGGRFFPFNVRWEVLVRQPDDEGCVGEIDLPATFHLLNLHVASSEFRSKAWGGVERLAQKIVQEEALVFLNLSLERRGFPERDGEKTLSTLADALCHFSLSQVFWIITNQIRHVSDKYRQGLSQGRPHASNQVISGIARYIERALANEWDVTHFKRDYELPQSVLSRVVFNHILKTDDGGFHTNLRELFSRYDDYTQYQEQLLAKMELDCPF
ncbi:MULTISPECIES: hypothetical protein [unclassified Cobetia]|uniref:hypothetical protein n=1 Tax=unclassified Cobetia TaxID=2609414 RepID=UPI002097B7A3|nr:MULTISPECIES: hypothetical protein [unclassified Cobetia]MCO7233951.1 hypothetical protein [Cobetia sp. Dlab-2-AX]MCO7237159.1 hypothetical protein [Cobetia sp. Dlab-2-U]